MKYMLIAILAALATSQSFAAESASACVASNEQWTAASGSPAGGDASCDRDDLAKFSAHIDMLDF
ncbi:hypothetical protein [Paludibacterium yongneupense]|uniref:hypothetical protein n=1 Tax=Paludibacterium yongneupense TaxID=400061 RepID=UPI00040BB44C|nr:hypothetical protein [Paludibacterium yongneupense]